MLKRIFCRVLTESRLWFPVTKGQVAQDVVVALTSYPARLHNLHMVIRSLLHQSLNPKEIVLYLGTDTKETDIPKSLRKLEKYNFSIKTGYPDVKPHKKYLFAMKEYSKDAIITIDDDILYDKNFVKDLYLCHKKFPKCVCSRRVHLMKKNDDGTIKSYNQWQWECKDIKEPSHQLFSTGCGGVLYPAGIFTEEAFDIEAIKKHCLNTDDVWLKFMELKTDTKVVFTDSKVIHPLTVRNTQESGLMHTNTAGENRNDINIQQMQSFTNINLADYCN